MMQYFLTNAFTSTPFGGNPACVCVPVKAVAESLTATQMHRLAAELSSVETVFVLPPQSHKTDFHLRFFTKKKENPFCGHATIAAAHILTSEFGFRSAEFYFTTNNGVVVVKRKASQNTSPSGPNGRFLYELNLRPSLPQLIFSQLGSSGGKIGLPFQYSDVAPIFRALNFQTTFVSSEGASVNVPFISQLRAVYYHQPSRNLIVLMNAAWGVLSANPDSEKLLSASPGGIDKVTITAIPSEAGSSSQVTKGILSHIPGPEQEAVEAKWRQYGFVTRLFAPWFGINEDAVSGASHAILAQVWRKEVPGAFEGHSSLRCYQPSPRGGEVIIDISDAEGGRVGISGEAVEITHGTVMVHHSKM